MKKTILFLFAAVVLGASCSKSKEVTQPEGCYMCTDVEQLYRGDVLVSTTSFMTYTVMYPTTDTLKSFDPTQGTTRLRFLDCVKIK